MTVGEWCAVLGYVALTVALGGLMLRAIRRSPDRLIDNWAAYFLCGQLVLTTLALTTGFAPWTMRQLLWPLIGAVALGTVWLARTTTIDRRAGRSLARELGFIVLALVLFPNLAVLVHGTPVFAWDARSIWFFHGKALYFSDHVDPAFFVNPQYWWSNLDYPLLIPAQAAWNSILLGEWSDIASRAFLLFQFAAWFRIAFAILIATGLPWWLSLFVTGAFLTRQAPSLTPAHDYVSGLADVHYAVPIVLAILAMTVRPKGRALSLIVLLLSYAANVKNEGLAYVLMIAGALGVLAAWRWWRSGGPREAPWLSTIQVRLAALAIGLGVVPVLLWAVFKARHGITGGLHLTERVFTPGLLASALAERSGTVIERMAFYYQELGTPLLLAVWAGLVLVSAWLARSTSSGLRIRPVEPLTVLLLCAMNGLIFVTYVLTPHDVLLHMNTSVVRLLFLPHMLVFLSCLFRLNMIVDTVSASRGSDGSTGAWRAGVR